MAVDPQSFFADPDPAIQYTIYSLHMYDYTIYSLHMYDFNVYSVLCTVYTIQLFWWVTSFVRHGIRTQIFGKVGLLP